jgi:4-amino-4-deoxy-L-arabinose transferase-like glycosyltransferase
MSCPNLGALNVHIWCSISMVFFLIIILISLQDKVIVVQNLTLWICTCTCCLLHKKRKSPKNDLMWSSYFEVDGFHQNLLQ